MKLTSKIIPTYSEHEHYAWEIYLHEQYAAAEADGREITYSERIKLVDDYVRENPNTADLVGRCEYCVAAAGEALLSGKPNVLSPRDVSRILSDFQIRGDTRKRTHPRRNGKAGDFGVNSKQAYNR